MPDHTTPIRGSTRLALLLSALGIGLFLAFILGEAILRLFPQFVADPPATPPYNYRVPHEKLGWVVQEGYRHSGELHDFKNNKYPLQLSFGKNGFRKWGDTASTRKKVLFLGDSYTACAQTSDDKLFYKILGDSLPVEVFAYGAAGYGNTQELMIAEHYLKEINPDLIVWQLCCNDFIDNYWRLEEEAGYQVRMRRPYTLEDGSLTYQTAERWPRSIKKYSHFLYFVAKRIGQWRGTFDQAPAESAEKRLAEQNLAYKPFARSVRMTDAIYKKMKALLPAHTKLLVFDADGFGPQYDHYMRLCAENNIPFAAGVDYFVREAEVAGECTRSDDGYHWNDRGNQLVAAFLKKKIEPMLK
jgi:hypothetical protein